MADLCGSNQTVCMEGPMSGADLQIVIVSLILIIVLVLLITEMISVDKTAMGIMVILALTGILTPKESVAGFSNPAVITVGAMFLLSRGMIRTGVMGYVTELVLNFSRGNRTYASILILISAAFASAFLNNTPVVVLFIPIVLGLSCEFNFSPSKLLIPLSYVSILAGTTTLIGTSTNIIVSDLAAAHGHGALSMFELSILGVPIAVLGIVLLMFISPGLMPGRADPVCELDEGKEKRYIAELLVPENSPLVGMTDISDHAETSLGLMVMELFRGHTMINPASTRTAVKPGDILMVRGSAEDLMACLKNQSLMLAHGTEGVIFKADIKDDLIIELIVPPLSSLLREPLLSTDLQIDSDIHIIALRSRQSDYSTRKLQQLRLRIGDTILVRCPRSKLDKIRQSFDFIVIEDIHHAIIDRDKANMAVVIFSGVVLAATAGLADIMVCALAGVLLMTLTHCLSLKDAYRSLESNVLLLIIGTIALGLAMEKTGATRLYADYFLRLFAGQGPGMVLFGVILLSSVFTHVLSNNATAVLLLPIALSTAVSLGVSPRPFIIGICMGASACFATPIGYQTNLLVFGPGGYRFLDYIKLGLPLNILVIVLSSIFIPRIWPF